MCLRYAKTIFPFSDTAAATGDQSESTYAHTHLADRFAMAAVFRRSLTRADGTQDVQHTVVADHRRVHEYG